MRRSGQTKRRKIPPQKKTNRLSAASPLAAFLSVKEGGERAGNTAAIGHAPRQTGGSGGAARSRCDALQTSREDGPSMLAAGSARAGGTESSRTPLNKAAGHPGSISGALNLKRSRPGETAQTSGGKTPGMGEAKKSPKEQKGAGHGGGGTQTERKKLSKGLAGEGSALPNKGTPKQSKEKENTWQGEAGRGGDDTINSSEESGRTPPAKKICADDIPPDGASPTNEPLDSSLQGIQLRELLQSLPNRGDLDAALNLKLEEQSKRLENMMKAEVQKVQETIGDIKTKIELLEEELTETKQKNIYLEDEIKSIQANHLDLALQVLDGENRSRRENIRIRGIPENVPHEALKGKVLEIFNFYLDRPLDSKMELDRWHRVPGGNPKNLKFPRDVVVKLHYYSDKEAILQGAWEKGAYTKGEIRVTLLQDLARKTLLMRKSMKPLLDELKQRGAQYKWGYPFSLIIRLNEKKFVLRTCDQLPALFSFLRMEPIVLPDWLMILKAPSK